MKILQAALSLLLLLFIACEETEEGCLDLLAENYSFEAVNACDSCCTYPSLSLRFNLFEDSIAYSLNDTLLLDDGDSIVFSDIELLFSSFAMMSGTNTYAVIDSIENGEGSIKDDFVLFINAGTRSVGTTAFEAELDAVSFILGFDTSAVNGLRPFENLDQDSKLDLALDSLYFEDDDLFYAAAFQINYPQRDTSFEILIDKHLLLRFDLNKAFVAAGQDWSLSLELDFRNLIEGLEGAMEPQEIKRVLSDNLPLSLSLE